MFKRVMAINAEPLEYINILQTRTCPATAEGRSQDPTQVTKMTLAGSSPQPFPCPPRLSYTLLLLTLLQPCQPLAAPHTLVSQGLPFQVPQLQLQTALSLTFFILLFVQKLPSLATLCKTAFPPAAPFSLSASLYFTALTTTCTYLPVCSLLSLQKCKILREETVNCAHGYNLRT